MIRLTPPIGAAFTGLRGKNATEYSVFIRTTRVREQEQSPARVSRGIASALRSSQ